MKPSRAPRRRQLLVRLLLGSSLLAGLAACAAKDPYRKPRSRDSWWGPEADSSERSFFYGSFTRDAPR